MAVGEATSFGLPDSDLALLLYSLKNELKSDQLVIDKHQHEGALHSIDIEPMSYEQAADSWLKQCSWQVRIGRDLYCSAVTAASQGEGVVSLPGGGFAYETDLETCRACEVPDDRILCADLSHLKMRPQLMPGPGKYGHPEGIFSASCRSGRAEIQLTANCRPGMNSCWHQTVSTTQWMPPPTDGLHVLEAFDFLDSAWRSLYSGERLVRVTSLSEAARLVNPVESYSDFRDQVARLAELLQKLNVSGARLRTQPVPSGSLERMSLWCRENARGGLSAVDRLAAINQIRNGISHRDPPKTAAAFSKLGMTFPPDSWSESWQIVAGQADNALRDLRRVVVGLIEN